MLPWHRDPARPAAMRTKTSTGRHSILRVMDRVRKFFSKFYQKAYGLIDLFASWSSRVMTLFLGCVFEAPHVQSNACFSFVRLRRHL